MLKLAGCILAAMTYPSVYFMMMLIFYVGATFQWIGSPHLRNLDLCHSEHHDAIDQEEVENSVGALTLDSMNDVILGPVSLVQQNWCLTPGVTSSMASSTTTSRMGDEARRAHEGPLDDLVMDPSRDAAWR